MAASGTARRDELHLLTLLVVGDLDSAAPRLIALLENPETRVNALMLVQHDRILATSPGAVAERAAVDALLARPDVAAAVERYGRVLEWDVFLGVE